MRVERAETTDELAAALAVRHAVFADEQGIDPAADRDGQDGAATHLLAVAEADDRTETPPLTAVADPTVKGQPARAVGANERVVGTTRYRLTDAGVRGERLAVLAPYRGGGYGSLLTERLLAEAADRGAERVLVHAQAHNVPFCRSHGFEATGERFTEVGIEHVEMVHHLAGVEPHTANR